MVVGGNGQCSLYKNDSLIKVAFELNAIFSQSFRSNITVIWAVTVNYFHRTHISWDLE
jgi:hypothetical protein